MSYSTSTLLTRNLHDVFGENDPARRRVAIDEIYTEDCVFYDPSKGVYRGRDEIDRIAGAIKATHPDFRYQPIAEWAMAGGSNGYRDALVRSQHTLVLISSLPRTAGLPPFIFFSTNYPDLDSAVLRHRDNERFVGATRKLCQRLAAPVTWLCNRLIRQGGAIFRRAAAWLMRPILRSSALCVSLAHKMGHSSLLIV